MKKSIVVLVLICSAFLVFFSIFPTRSESAEIDSQVDRSPFYVSPSLIGYFPTSGKTKCAFGDSWWGVGVTINPQAFGIDNVLEEFGNAELYPFLAYYHGEKGNNEAHIIPLGVDARWRLFRDRSDDFRPYAGIGAFIAGVKFNICPLNYDCGWKGTFGGRAFIGFDLSSWFNLQASYNWMSDVGGFDFSGFEIRGTFNFYM